jgi:uncharacterized protein
MLRVDIRRSQGGAVATRGEIPADQLDLAHLGYDWVGPVKVEGELHPTAEGDFLWRGRVQAVAVGECCRCLAEARQELDESVEALFSADPDLQEDPGVYPVPPHAEAIDLTPAIREELLLRLSAFPLCRADCRGLCPRCGADLNAGPCQCAAAGTKH